MAGLKMIFLASAIGMLFPSISDAAGQVGHLAPAFELETIDGEVFRLSDYRGKKPVYVIFWNTWCPYCIKKVARFRKIQERLGNKIAIIAINTGWEDSPDEIEHFRKHHEINYRLALDKDETVTNQYNVGGVPTEFVVDIYGVIRYRDYVPKHLAAHLPDWFQPYSGTLPHPTCSQ